MPAPSPSQPDDIPLHEGDGTHVVSLYGGSADGARMQIPVHCCDFYSEKHGVYRYSETVSQRLGKPTFVHSTVQSHYPAHS